MKLETLAKKDQQIVLMAGKNGSGKSGAIASYAELGPLKLYDLDKRARGILGIASVLGKQVIDNIEVIQPDFEKGWAPIDKELDLDLIKSKQGSFPYKTVAFEGAATMQKYLISDSQRLRGKGGRSRGAIDFWVPDDYNYCSMGFFQFYYQYAMLMKCNVIVSCWMVDRWGKPKAGENDKEKENAYAESERIGDKLLLTDKLSEEVPGYFDEIYSFEKEETSLGGGGVKFVVTFESTLAKTCYPSLRKQKRLDITNKSFYRELQRITQADRAAFDPSILATTSITPKV